MIKMFVYKLKINIKCSILILYVPWCKWFYGVPIHNLAFMFHNECNSSLYFRPNIHPILKGLPGDRFTKGRKS